MSIEVFSGVVTETVCVVSYPQDTEVGSLTISLPENVELDLPKSIPIVSEYPLFEYLNPLP